MSRSDPVYLQISDAFVFVDVSPLSLLKYTLSFFYQFLFILCSLFPRPRPGIIVAVCQKRILRWIRRFLYTFINMHLCIASPLVTALLLYIKSIIKLELFFFFYKSGRKKKKMKACVCNLHPRTRVCARVCLFRPPRTHTRPLCRVSPW